MLNMPARRVRVCKWLSAPRNYSVWLSRYLAQASAGVVDNVVDTESGRRVDHGGAPASLDGIDIDVRPPTLEISSTDTILGSRYHNCRVLYANLLQL